MPPFSPAADPARHSGPRWYALAVAAVLGGILGLGSLTFVHAGGTGYLGDDPRTCANCHVMFDYYDSWNRSPHHGQAVCNDCHIPHTFPMKYVIKGYDGINHSYHFTVADYPANIQITDLSKQVVQENCLDCHKSVVNHIVTIGNTRQEELDCVACHRHVGH